MMSCSKPGCIGRGLYGRDSSYSKKALIEIDAARPAPERTLPATPMASGINPTRKRPFAKVMKTPLQEAEEWDSELELDTPEPHDQTKKQNTTIDLTESE
jgi:hypothetical protein